MYAYQPTYTPNLQRLAARLRERPHTLAELAAGFGVSTATLHTYLSKLAKFERVISRREPGQRAVYVIEGIS